MVTFFKTGDPGTSKFVLGALRESPSGNRHVAPVTVRLRGRDSATFSYDHS
jgi:hypothetical protein